MAIHPTYDPDWLNHQYNNRLHVPGFQVYLDRWERQSREIEQRLPLIKDLPYGALPRERLTIFPAARPGAKTLVFIHGGYWHLLDKSLFYFLADAFREKGITTVFLNYPLAPEASMDEIVLSCRNALAWLYHHLANYGGDPGQLYIAGHSAGGHLAAMLVATDWLRFSPGLPANLLKGACFVSGLFDLEPIRLSYLNTVLGMDEAAAVRNSPVGLKPLAHCPILVAGGEDETAAFQDQHTALYQNWNGKAGEIRLLSLPGKNHFSAVEAIAEKENALHISLCRWMDQKQV